MSSENATEMDSSVVDGDEMKQMLDFQPSNFNISIHYLLTSSQNAHGLRHDDYAQYHSYLTRRLSRLRHTYPVRKNLTHYGPYKKGIDTLAVTATTATNKASSKKLGKHAFHPRPQWSGTQANDHKNYILVELYSAERAWAHSMELKTMYDNVVSSSSNTINNTSKKLFSSKSGTSPGKLRQHYLRRLKKAMKHAESIERIVNERVGICNERTCMDIKAYGAWMRGNWYCESGKWKIACQEYAMSLNLCEALAKDTVTTNEGFVPDHSNTQFKATAAEALQLSDFFHNRANNVLQPLLRYCQYELKQEGLFHEDEIAALTEEAIKSGTTAMNEYVQAKLNAIKESELKRLASTPNSDGNEVTIQFRGKTILIEDTSLRVAMLKLQQIKKEIGQMPSNTGASLSIDTSKQDAMFLELLNSFDDALSIVSDMHKEYFSMTSGPSVNKKRFESEVLRGYFKFCKIQALMERNEKMVDKLREQDRDSYLTNRKNKTKSNKCLSQEDDNIVKYKRVEEIAHLYDALLQDAQAVTILPGGGDGSDDSQGEEIEDEFAMQASAMVLRIRALRCYYVGRMYGSDTIAKYPEALALYDQALKLASEAAEEMAAIDANIDVLVALEKEIVSERCRANASAFLVMCGSNASSATTGLPLVRRLDDFDAGGPTYNLSSVPPSLEPIPCKPAFFDIANSYVTEFPLEDLQHHVNAHHLQSKGFLRWFRRS